MYFFCSSFAFMELYLAAITVLMWLKTQYLIHMQCYVNIKSFIYNAPITDLGFYFICFNMSHYSFHYFFLINFTYKYYPSPRYNLIYIWMEITRCMTLILLWHTSELLSHFIVQLISKSFCSSSLPSRHFLFVCLF